MNRLLIALLLLAGCASQPSWSDEIGACLAAYQTADCYTLAGFAIHQHCQTTGFRPLAALVFSGTPPDAALTIAQSEGWCPSSPSGAGAGVVEGQ